MGRAKVELKKIENKARRQTTFTKRRQGLFKKAADFCQKCNAQVMIIAFSNAGNVYAFGDPHFDIVFQRYDEYSSSNNNGERLLKKKVQDEYKDTIYDLEIEERVGEIMEGVVACGAGKEKASWNEAIEDLGLLELEELNSTMEKMKKKVVDCMNNLD